MLSNGRKTPDRGKKDQQKAARTADQPGQAVNIDLCFLPNLHEAQGKLPAVSGSSGHLVVERVSTREERAEWPGQIFENRDLSFEAAMQAYVQATRDRLVHSRQPREPEIDGSTRWRKEWEGRAERHDVLQQRLREDKEWKTAKTNFHLARLAFQQLSKPERKQQRAAWQAKQVHWHQRREQRQRTLQNRQKENQAWHERNRALHTRSKLEQADLTWIAVLVVIDNCTRQCRALPVFPSGPKLTSQEVVDALPLCLPASLQFLISDQGKHFKTICLSQFAKEKGFNQVLVYRHRPQSNGIAERFVLTFKRWLRTHCWKSVEELQTCISVFLPEYNDRPHQGLPIPGLSPNEFAYRLQLKNLNC